MKQILLLLLIGHFQIYSQHFSKSIPIQFSGLRDGSMSKTIDISGIHAPDFIGFSFYLEGSQIDPSKVKATLTTSKYQRQVLPFGEDPNQENRWVSELLYLEPSEAGTCKLDIIFLDDQIKDVKGEVRVFVPQLSSNTNETMTKKASPSRFLCPCPQPNFVPRTSWGSGFGLNESIFIGPPVYTKVTHLIVHHSAGTNVSNNWAGVVAAIFDFHVNTNKWSDVGYNWLIDPNGIIYEGRGGGDNVRGAHMCGYNNNSMAACLLGNFEVAQPTDAMMASLTRLFSWKACKENITPVGSSAIVSHTGNMQHISGHKDGCSPNYTQCPGQNLYVKLPNVRTSTSDYINGTCSVVASTNEFYKNGVLNISPNPAYDFITISKDIDDVNIEKIEIFDITGRSVLMSFNDDKINVSTLRSGIYSVLTTSKTGRNIGRFIKI